MTPSTSPSGSGALAADHPVPPAPTAGLGTTPLIVVLAGAFLAIADFFIVNVALGDIASRLRATPAQLELVVAGYGVSYAVLLVLGGRLGDSFGRRRLYASGLVAFVAFSLLCGLAPDATWLVAFRVLQGISAAVLVPQVLATLQATTTGARRTRALGLFGATGGLAAVVGQAGGGWLVSADLFGAGWRSVFLVNVPVGLAALALVRRIPETRAERPAGVDLGGTVLLAAAVVALIVPLTEGRVHGWPVWSWVLLAASPVAAWLLRRVELQVERAGRIPLLPPSVVQTPGMRWGLAFAVPFFVGFGGFMFVYAVTVQLGLGWSPARAGLGLAPMAAAFLVASLATPRLLPRIGRTILTGGVLLQATGLAALAATLWLRWDQLSVLDLTVPMIILGAGQGLVVSPLMGLVLAGVPADRAGVGGGVLTTTQQAALAVGAAGVGTFFGLLAEPDRLGVRDAVVAVLLGQCLVALGCAVLSRWLPDHGRS